MKKQPIIPLSWICLATILWVVGLTDSSLSAQPAEQFRSVFDAIDNHAPRLAAYAAQREARQEAARQTNVLADPELEFSYFWLSPSELGNSWCVNLRQTFDFPLVYMHRSRAVRQATQNADWQYLAEREDLMLQAHQLCIELVCHNAMIALVEQQQTLLDSLQHAQQQLLDAGSETLFSYHDAAVKAQLCDNDLACLRSARSQVQLELSALCGSDSVCVDDTLFFPLPADILPASFDEWFVDVATQSPMLQYVAGEVARLSQDLKTTRSEWWPKLSLGYVYEDEPDVDKHGVTFGISLPAWNNRRRVRQAKAELVAAQAEADNSKRIFMARLEGLYRQTVSARKAASQLQSLLERQQTPRLLAEALQAGQIAKPAYYEAMYDYLDLKREQMELQREFQLALAELLSVPNFSAR